MRSSNLAALRGQIEGFQVTQTVGQVVGVGRGLVTIAGNTGRWPVGERIVIHCALGMVAGEIVALADGGASALMDGSADGIRLGDRVELTGRNMISPHDGWIGRVVDPFGRPLDGRPLLPGTLARDVRASAPPPASRKRLGGRLETGMCIFNTFLPLVRGQRIGLFAGSGVGKSWLLGQFARNVEADVVVIALIGERGRELRDFVEGVLGPEGMARAVVVIATSDQPPLVRRMCGWSAMTVAEHFRDQGRQVLFLADSMTRMAEAHREVSLSAGESPALRGHPPSMAHLMMSLAERAGPGVETAGDITAVFSVLVAGSDMDEPVADVMRGVLDGHVVLDRAIAERGRFPAIDLLRSVSRALPAAASAAENGLITEARRLRGAYDRAELMIQAGLYASGSDPMVDASIRVWSALDAFLAAAEPIGTTESFDRLAALLDKGRGQPG